MSEAGSSRHIPGDGPQKGGHRVEGNFIGTYADGTRSDRNARGVSLIGADDSIIGGTSPEDRNLISGNVHSGVEVSGSSGNTIRNNLIGPERTPPPRPPYWRVSQHEAVLWPKGQGPSPTAPR
jgi:hypothetical protein